MNEHVTAYRAGDRRAIEPAYHALESYMGYLAKEYRVRGYDGEEAFADAALAWAEALNVWKPTGGYKFFYHYAKQNMKWRVGSNRYKIMYRSHLAAIASVDDIAMYTDGVDQEEKAMTRVLLTQILDLAPTAKMRAAIILKASGMSNVQAGKELGVSNQYIWTVLKQIKEKL